MEKRRSLSRVECLELLRSATAGRVAITVGALPHIAPVRYYVVEETIFLDTSTCDIEENIVGNVIAFEGGIARSDGDGVSWSVCAVGVALPSEELCITEPILRLHPELIRGWMSVS